MREQEGVERDGEEQGEEEVGWKAERGRGRRGSSIGGMGWRSAERDRGGEQEDVERVIERDRGSREKRVRGI